MEQLIKKLNGEIQVIKNISKKTQKPYLAVILNNEGIISYLSFDKLTIMRLLNITLDEYDCILYKE